MKILLVNPNTSTHVTERMVAQARKTVGARAEVEGVTATFGPAIIGSRTENAIAAHGALDVAARHYVGADAILLGVSMDTALAPMRELFAVPVVGMAEAGFLMSCSLGQRVGCLTLGRQLLPLYEELTDSYGFSSRVACWRALELPAAYGSDLLPAVTAAVAESCEAMAREDGAEVVMLCGAVLTGYAELLAGEVSVPVVDCIDAAARMALSLAERDAALGGAAAVPRVGGRRSLGLGAELTRLLERQGA